MQLLIKMEKEIENQCPHDPDALLMCIAEDCQQQSKLACRFCLVSLHSHSRILLRRLTQDEAKLCQYAPALDRKTAIFNILKKSSEKIKTKISNEIDEFLMTQLNKVDEILPWAVSDIYSNYTTKGRQLDNPYNFKCEDYPLQKIDDSFNKYLELAKRLDQVDWKLPQQFKNFEWNEKATTDQQAAKPPEQPPTSEDDKKSFESASMAAIAHTSLTDTSAISVAPLHTFPMSIQGQLIEIPQERCHSSPSSRSLFQRIPPRPNMSVVLEGEIIPKE